MYFEPTLRTVSARDWHRCVAVSDDCEDMALKDPQVRCLFVDVFGTCVDWRKTVTDELTAKAGEALSSPAASIASRIRMLASNMTTGEWGECTPTSCLSYSGCALMR